MKLSEVFSQLAYGELVQLGVINETGDSILPSKYGQMVAHINLGLSALYKRFPLKESRVVIRLQKGKVTYLLNSEEDTLFIENTDSPEFIDDIHKIERVYTSAGVEFPLNDESSEYSCFTPSMTTLRVPYAVVNTSVDVHKDFITDNITIVYRAAHPKIIYKDTGFKPKDIEIELPSSHLEPLLLYVASRINNPIGMTNEFHAGNSYYAKYEKACQDLEIQNIRVDQGKQNNRLRANGWV